MAAFTENFELVAFDLTKLYWIEVFKITDLTIY